MKEVGFGRAVEAAELGDRPRCRRRDVLAVAREEGVRDGEALLAVDQVPERGVLHVGRPYPYNYFFNDHPNAGVRSYDYIYSVMGVISLGLMSCSQLCLIPLQFKALGGGGDGEGGPTLSGIGMPNM